VYSDTHQVGHVSKKESFLIKPLTRKPVLKPKAKVQTNSARAIQEFIDSGLEFAEVSLEMPRSGAKGLLIGLNKAIGKDRKDKYEARLTTDNKVVLIKKE